MISFFDKPNSNAGDALVVTLTVATGVILAGLTFLFFETENTIKSDISILDNIEKMQATTLRLERAADLAIQGSADEFAEIKQARQEFTNLLKWLKIGNAQQGVTKIDDVLVDELTNIESEWMAYKQSIDKLLSAEKSFKALLDFSHAVDKTIPSIVNETRYIISVMTSSKDTGAFKFIAEQQFLVQQISADINRLLSGDVDSDSHQKLTFEQLSDNAQRLGVITLGLLEGKASLGIKAVKGSKARAGLQKINDSYQVLEASLNQMQNQVSRLLEVETTLESARPGVAQLINDVSLLGQSFQVITNDRIIVKLEVYGLFAAILFFVFTAVATQINQKRNMQKSKERENLVAQENAQNQGAILQLLDEIAGLGDGDLSRNATVTEDITGSIADAFNYTIEQLRSLVKKINHITNLVTSAAQTTKATSTDLAVASKKQSSHIAGVTDGISDVAQNMTELSKDASSSTRAAHESVDTAKQGARAVHNTIDGMEKIREQIQETSKRIKRLGESSQEIGEIVSLIHDISEQTNMLALNAAIQAAMAGEAGRGFAVVADEVQHLAERSTKATKQIEKLVKTIQTDTNEAVLSMENSTTGVVDGARLAQEAGNALGQIELMSENIAARIDSMSAAANKQVGKAMAVNDTMREILDVNAQASTGINQTAKSVGNLASLVNELRVSVSGFKLPAD